MTTHEQITQMFIEDSDDEFFLGLLILVQLIHGSTVGWLNGPKTWCGLYMSIYGMWPEKKYK